MAQKQTLRDLFIMKIQALYDVETELVKALPKMAKAATDPELKAGFDEHLEETEEHVNRLENVFELLDEKPKKLKVEAIRGLAEDAEWLVENVEEGNALDASLIGAARYVEHYEMAGYMGAQEWATLLEEEDAAALLEETYEEEKGAEEKLSELATSISARLDGVGEDD